MTALHLHNSLLTGEKDPISPSFNSSAFQDLISRQPTHPDGPRAGWDLGLNLLGDPPTTAEYRSVEEHFVKNKLRRLRRATVAFEFLFGLWGAYTMVRYFLAFATVTYHTQCVFSLALGIVSAIAVAATIVTITLPLFHGSACVHSCRQMRSLLRACFLSLILLASATNLALVVIWRPNNRCAWDIDISWYLSAVDPPATRCDPATFTMWIIAAVLRLLLTSILIVLFMYILRAYRTARHPSQREIQRRGRSHRPMVSPSDPENVSPTKTSQPSTSSLLTSKRTFSFSTLIRPSHKQLRRSSSTLAPSDSSGTLVPSLSHTGTAQSSPPNNASSSKCGMPSAYRPTVGWFSNGGISSANQKANLSNVNRGSSAHRGASDGHGNPDHDGADVDVAVYGMSEKHQLEEAVTPKSRILRRTSRFSNWLPPAASSRSEKISVDKAYLADGIRFHGASLKAKVAGASGAYDDSDVDSVSSSDQTSDPGIPSYAYGYGAPGSSYPYLNLYNPPPSAQHSGPSSSASVESTQDKPSSHSSVSDVSDFEDDRDEFVPMMGRYVRRMRTIESLGSREVSTLGGAKSLHLSTAGSRSPSLMIGSVSSCMGGLSSTNGSQLSPLQLSLSSSAPSASMPLSNSECTSGSSTGKSCSTTYLSLSGGSSIGGTGTEAISGMGARVRVTERGELIIIPDSASASGTSSPISFGRRYWTASSGQSAHSGQSLPATMEEGRF